MSNKLLMEFIGAFFLILIIAFTGNPMAIGVVLVALVYMGGYISGAHYNPAVTVALWINNKIEPMDAMKYIGTQMLAGVVAAAFFNVIAGSKFLPSPALDADLAGAFLIEALFTFLLCSVILHVAATDKTKGNNYYGIAIGFTLIAIAYAGGPISGGAFNPAVGVSPLLYDFMNFGSHFMNITLYLIGPIVGGILAGMIYKTFNEKKKFLFW
ncbi:MAG TPA: aquaporin [Candidatus Woesebacteria bacterium]|nr:aquaporin [Candidatus Woesebacteria bacterium]